MAQGRARTAAAFLAIGALLAGCERGEVAADKQQPATPGNEQSSTDVLTTGNPVTGRGPCQAVGRTDTGMLRLCFKPNRDFHGQFVVISGGTARAVAVTPPGPTPTASDAGKAGHWAWAALSPDRTRILAQWSGECEVPIAFVVSATGGTPQPVTGEDDWATSPDSVALGWTTDGRVAVFLPKGPACGSGSAKPGIYVYSEPGAGELLTQTRQVPLRASTKPRTAKSLRQAAS